MRKRLYILAAGLGLSCAAASAATLHLPQSAAPVYTRTGSSDGAGLPGAPGGKAGRSGSVGAMLRGLWSSDEGDKLYEYCAKAMEDIRRGDGFAEGDERFLPSDCVDIFVVPFEKGAGERFGHDGKTSYDEDLFSYCVDLLRQARREEEGLPGYKGKRRTYSSDFSPRECAEYFASLEMMGKDNRRYSLKRNGQRGLGLYGGIGGKSGKAGRGLYGGRGGDGGDGVDGGVGGRGGRGGDDLSGR